MAGGRRGVGDSGNAGSVLQTEILIWLVYLSNCLNHRLHGLKDFTD